MITAEQVAEHINPPDFYHSPLTSLVCLENTTNKGGGACYDFAEIEGIRRVCDENSLGLHLDGARLMNALVSTKEDPKRYGAVFDTISLCLSKGLGTPLGTLLAGKKELMEGAMRVRKILGGGMRQVGFMAAAGLYALEHHVVRLSEDHRKASEIAKTLSKCSFIKNVEPTDTNIVIFYLDDSKNKKDFLADLERMNIRISSMGQGKLRVVTHLDYTDEMHERFLNILTEYA
jgi:threonine aldolase